MLPIRLDVSRDTTRLVLAVGGEATELTAEGVERMIAHLSECRERMSPVPAPIQPELPHTDQDGGPSWRIAAVADEAAIQFATLHPALGWTEMWLSREQAEDLVASVAIELMKIPESR